jgi:hypothetical protein
MLKNGDPPIGRHIAFAVLPSQQMGGSILPRPTDGWMRVARANRWVGFAGDGDAGSSGTGFPGRQPHRAVRGAGNQLPGPHGFPPPHRDPVPYTQHPYPPLHGTPLPEAQTEGDPLPMHHPDLLPHSVSLAPCITLTSYPTLSLSPLLHSLLRARQTGGPLPTYISIRLLLRMSEG